MKNNMKEMNLEQMEKISGGTFRTEMLNEEELAEYNRLKERVKSNPSNFKKRVDQQQFLIKMREKYGAAIFEDYPEVIGTGFSINSQPGE